MPTPGRLGWGGGAAYPSDMDMAVRRHVERWFSTDCWSYFRVSRRVTCGAPSGPLHVVAVYRLGALGVTYSTP